MSESIEFPESGGSIDFLSIEHPRRLEGRRADIVYIEPIWTLMQDRLLREIQVLRARGAEVVRA